METWEVVLILVLITIAITVIAKHEVPLGFIELLDNAMFQMAILGLTLAVAVISPPVAITAIATIVIVYYIRNIVKLQLAAAISAADNVATAIMMEETTPRIEIHEKEVIQTQSVIVENQPPPVSAGTLPVVNQPHQADNKDTIENALKEHEHRQPPEGQRLIGTQTTQGGSAPIKDMKPPAHEDMPNPRNTAPHPPVESFDTQAPFHAKAPVAGQETTVINSKVDSDVFSEAPSTLEPYNEVSAAPALRSFEDNAGQFNIGDNRPHTDPQKYEIADYMPASDMGRNNFQPVGVSIDDKINILKKGLMPVSGPPPDFNTAVPPKAHIH